MNGVSNRVDGFVFYLGIASVLVYALIFTVVVARARSKSDRALAIGCLSTSVWSFASVMWSHTDRGDVEFLDLVRMLCWYSYLLLLYVQSGIAPKWHIRSFTAIACVGFLLAAFLNHSLTLTPTLLSLPFLLRLTISIAELLLIENLYLNLPEHARWHIALPCISLGGVACLDLLTSIDMIISHQSSISVADARFVVLVGTAPLLILAATRGQRWTEPVRLSKTAVFHSATLVLCGGSLLSLGLIGELLRYWDGEVGWVAELSLLFLGVIAGAVVLSSRSTRSLIQRLIIYHFFADRFDYRLQWLRCIATLSGTLDNERTTLPVRAIRVVSDVVDSPSGSLFLREKDGVIAWAGSWNTPGGPNLDVNQAVLRSVIQQENVVEFSAQELTSEASRNGTASWLGVPLLHVSGAVGIVIVGHPRTRFKLDQEVFDLLKIVGREVANCIVEQQATETLHQHKDLTEYGRRFSFVAHDIKNVSSQLSMLVQNAETHLADPDFQSDMIQTVKSSVQKIDHLIRRLHQPTPSKPPGTLVPSARLELLIAFYKRIRQADIVYDDDGSFGEIAISQSSFEAVMTHLLNNAVEASQRHSVRVSIQHEVERVVIEITDRGPGMSTDFVRDALFKPLHTNKEGGTGIGAFQARELLREVGAQLIVVSEINVGTTMRIIFSRVDKRGSRTVTTPLASSAGQLCV